MKIVSRHWLKRWRIFAQNVFLVHAWSERNFCAISHLEFVSKRPVSKSRRVLRRRLDANCSIYIHEHKMRLSVIVSLLKKTVSFICHSRWEHFRWQVVATRRGNTFTNCFFFRKSLSPRRDLLPQQVACTHLKWSDFVRRLEATNPVVEAKICTRILL